VETLPQNHHSSTSQVVLVVDQSLASVDDCDFGMGWTDWRNCPTTHPSRGAAFSFADGHVERWQWVGLTQEQPIFTAVTPAAQPDFQRLLNAVVFR
jgi:prepilin-type processing-associated H-X9-DG protein